MPNRILKESICYSENVDGLTLFQEVFFYRLIVNCDDFGRMDARTKVLSSKLFPLRDIDDGQVLDALAALVSAELITVYEAENHPHPYLQMNTWDRHQNIRAKKSKYPELDSNCKQLNADDIRLIHMNSYASNCNQMNTNVPVIQSNTIQSESISESEYENPNPTRNPSPVRRKAKAADELFDLFWEEYPRKESKPAAKKAFDKIGPDRELVEKMIESIRRWKLTSQWKENGGQFIPYPASWLNQQKWNDEPPVQVQTAQRNVLPAQDFQQRDYSGVQDEMLKQLNAELMQARRDGII